MTWLKNVILLLMALCDCFVLAEIEANSFTTLKEYLVNRAYLSQKGLEYDINGIKHNNNHKETVFGKPLTTLTDEMFFDEHFDTEMTTTSASPHPVCGCVEPKIWYEDSCYNSIQAAINGTQKTPEVMVYIGSSFEITDQISVLTTELSLYGVDCSGDGTGKPLLTSSVAGVEDIKKGVMIDDKAVFFLHGNHTYYTMRIRDLDIQSKKYHPDGTTQIIAHVILTPQNVRDDEHWTSLDIRNCKFLDFTTRNHGTVFLLKTAYRIMIDNSTVFENNRMHGYCDCYPGGMVSAMAMFETSEVKINAMFKNNEARYFYDWQNDRLGSEHAEGGAIYIYYSEGLLELGGTFIGNSANEGGAVVVKTLGGLGKVHFLPSSHFENNFVHDTGAQCRGGAIRIFDVLHGGQIYIQGTYINNTATKGGTDEYSNRGGVFAGNYLKSGSKLIVDGKFIGNECNKWGGVISMQGFKDPPGKEIDGKIILKGSCVFEKNRAKKDEDTDIMWLHGHKHIDQKDWDNLNGEDWEYN